jgi:hypothetical protein
MSAAANVVWPIVLGFLGWLVFQLIGRPIRDFLDLRREIRRRMLQFGNVPVFRPAPGKENLDVSDLIPGAKEARDIFRDLGSQMRSFGETEHGATWILERLGFDPVKAGKSLFGLSNTIAKHGPDRSVHRKDINAALRIEGDDA